MTDNELIIKSNAVTILGSLVHQWINMEAINADSLAKDPKNIKVQIAMKKVRDRLDAVLPVQRRLQDEVVAEYGARFGFKIPKDISTNDKLNG